MGFKRVLFVAMCVTVFSFSGSLAFAQISASEAEIKAREVHALAESNPIYLDQDIRALYYQNIQIIDLLRGIRDLLARNLLQQNAKEMV